MRNVLTALLVSILMLIAGSPTAQPGAIVLYTDPGFTNCNLVDAAPGLLQIFVVHDFSSGARAVWFAIEECGAFQLTYLAWTSAHSVTVGDDPNVGVVVTYDGGCSAGPILVGTISYFANGLSGPCAYLRVVPDPVAASGRIEGVNCLFQTTFLDGYPLTVNSDGSCVCGALTCSGSGSARVCGQNLPPCHPTPVEETSWGRVKALYR